MVTNRTPIHRKAWSYLALEMDDRPVSLEEWCRHRNEIMQYEATFGRRPEEWWLYEHDMEKPENQGAVLYDMGNELRPEELDYLMEFWRKHFDLAMSPGFAISHPVEVGGDHRKGSKLTTGLEAQRSHLEWAGIPQSLLKRWHAERRKGTA